MALASLGEPRARALIRPEKNRPFVLAGQLKLVLAVLVPSAIYAAAIIWIGIYVASVVFIGVLHALAGQVRLVEGRGGEPRRGRGVLPHLRDLVQGAAAQGPDRSLPRAGLRQMDEIQSLMHGFAVALTPTNLVLMFTGVILGVIIGVLPGLGGANGVAILLPLTFGMAQTAGRRHLGHHPALVHLLGRALRRRHHLDPVQHPGRALVGGDHLRRLSAGAAGARGQRAHRGVHLLVHRRAGGGDDDHVPLADRRQLRARVRAARILRASTCSPSAPSSA